MAGRAGGGKRGASSYREGAEQALFARRMALDPRTRDLPWSATMTGVNLGIKAAAMRKAQGVRRGVPDFLLFQHEGKAPHWRERLVGLAIEFKNPDGSGRLSSEQAAWYRMLEENDWRVEVAKNAVEAWAAVADHLGFPP